MKKKVMSVVLAASMLAGMTMSAVPAAAAEEEGKVLNIYCWNEEFQSRYMDYFDAKGLLPEGVTVNWVITPNENNGYQDKLDETLLNQENADADDKIDIFLIEADYALKYVDSEYTLDVKNDIGLTDEDLKDQYKYTQDIATDSNGALKGVTWQATPGLFAYRRSIAKDVLGTDDPDEVQAALADWTKFEEVAAKAAEKGYKMLSGYDDAYRTFSNNVSGPWVDEDLNVVVDENLMNWVDQTKSFTDNGYNNKTALWADGWNADQGPDGKVFGFFYSTWGINFTLLGNSLETPVDAGGKEEVGNGAFGDWAVCEGPQNYYWGGTWICAAKDTDNPTLIHDIMYTLTCDPVTMKAITEDTQDYTNNQTAMGELADSDFQSAFLGGQNHIKLFAEAAPKIDMSNISPYDQGCNEEFQAAFKDYFDGNVEKEEALSNFYTAITEKYPELNTPE
ncbi:carbohydrate ABC transporter substrate-binding protein [Blautia schinkii]|nr:carbohydrate ABC transporter substrate-binding protein [Blautia schinkii]